MKILELVMVLFTPFFPKRVFKSLALMQSKLLLSLISLIIVGGAILYLEGIVYNSRAQHLGYLGVLLPLRIMGLLLTVIAIILGMKIALIFTTKQSIPLLDLLAIISVSTLPLLIDSTVKTMLCYIELKDYLIKINPENIESTLRNYDYILKGLQISGYLFFGMLLAYGISVSYKIKYLKSLLITCLGFGIALLILITFSKLI